MPTRGSRFTAVWAILAKECRSEWRTRYGLNAALLFAVSTLTSVSFAAGRLGDRTDIVAALLWIVLLFAALAALGHTFARESEAHTLTLLRLTASPAAIALGKLLFNLLFLVVLEVVAVPLALVLLGAPAPRWGPFLGTLALGSATLAIAMTLVGALIAQTRGRAALLAGAAFPLLLPLLAAAVSATRAQWLGASAAPELRLLATYAFALMAASLLLYDHLWED